MTIQMETNHRFQQGPSEDDDRSDSQQYLSLREAAQLYGYTRDHLGLMIRRGKLGGVRLGTYYATTAAWMNEYIKNYSGADNSKAKIKFSNRFRSGILDKKQSSNISPAVIKRAVESPKIVVARESNVPNLKDLQKHIDEVLAQVAPKTASVPAIKLLEPKLISIAPKFSAASVVEETQARGGHEIIILPVRKMHDFERQIIISQAKQQKNTK